MQVQIGFFVQALILIAGLLVIDGQLACPHTYRCEARGYICSMVMTGSGPRIPRCIKAGLTMQGYPPGAGTGSMTSGSYPYTGRRFRTDFWGQNPSFRQPYTGGFWDRLVGGTGNPTDFGHLSQTVGGDVPVVLPSRPNVVEDTSSTNNNVNIVNNNANKVHRSNSGNVHVNQHSTSNTASGPAVDPSLQPVLPDPMVDPGFRPVLPDPMVDPGFRPVISDSVIDPVFHPAPPGSSVDQDPHSGNPGILLGPVKPHVM